ncbi:MAG: MFS transporter [Rickettsiaceae bacterium]|nr:MFS transporter [Rickettsiaceae bacterium]
MYQSNIFKLFTDYKQFQIFILGILSGMPLFIIYSTIAAWMKGANIDIAIITSFAAARAFYSLKVFWSPLIDHLKLPILHHIGKRKSWMCLISGIIAVIIFLYSKLDPNKSIGMIYVLTIALGVASATLDIVIDAFRIDTIEKEKLSVAAANAVFGYRVGGLIAVAGAFFIAEDYGWNIAFLGISFLYFIGIFFILTLKEPKIAQKAINILSISSWSLMTIDPFADFLKRDVALVILLAVVFYKLGDAMLGVVAMPFYMELGFTLKEIGAITKVFGLIATICGAYVGGVIMYRYGSLKGLIFCGVAQAVTNLAFVWLHHQGHNTNALMIAISIENMASGMGDAALVGYLSYLCNKQFSATQYALLSSLSGLFSHTIVGFGGSIMKVMGWDNYFIMTVFLAIPGLLLLLYLNKKFEGKTT